MKVINYSINVIKTIIALLICISMLNAKNVKLAQAGFEFLSVVSDARAAAIADAVTSLETGSSSLFFNPAGMARLTSFIDITASHNQWIADIVHNTFSLAISPAKGRFGVIGFSYQNVNYGEFYGTRVNKNIPSGYDDTGIFHLSANAIGVGYAKKLTEWFSVGGQIRYVKQDLGKSVIPKISKIPDTTAVVVENVLTPLSFDFGTQYRTGFKGIVFGMSVRNFSKEIKYVQELFQLPLVFNLGVSMDILEWLNNKPQDQAVYISIDASHYRSRPEQLKVGLEWEIFNTLYLRGGYITNSDESDFSFGVGISRFRYAIDYAYVPYGVFNSVKRITVRISF